MRDLGLDGLVKANRTVTAPSDEARARNRRQLARRLASGVVAAAAVSSARDAAGALTAGAAPVTAAGTSGVLSGAVAKWVVVSTLVALGGGAGVSRYVASRRAAAPAPPIGAVAASSAPIIEAAPSAPEEAAPTDTTPSPAASDAPAPAEGASSNEARSRREPAAATAAPSAEGRSLERELYLLRSAQRALDAGSPAQALSLLDRYSAEFPHGVLKQECQTARIIALCAAGRRGAAQQAKDRFLKQEPGSPLAERVRATCGVGGR